MAIAITILYLALTVLSPEQLFPTWAPYRPMLILAALAIVVTLPNLLREAAPRSALQTKLLLAFTAAMCLSQVANFWFGGVQAVFEGFLPSLVLYSLIAFNVTGWGALRAVMITLLLAGLTLATEGALAMRTGWQSSSFVLHEANFQHEQLVGYVDRMKGVGFFSDPNDLAQYLLVLIPIAFAFWKPRSFPRNVLLVLLPCALLGYGIYLTHSRGAAIALVVVALFGMRKRFGRAGGLVVTGLLVAVLIAGNFTGGREVNVEEGSSRIEAWSDGLELFKSNPIFGIGFSRFTEHSTITAHNSFILVLAENGLLGAMLWVAIIVTTWLEISCALNSKTIPARDIDTGSLPPGSQPVPESGSLEYDQQARRMLEMLRIALVAFLTTAFFLSRTYAVLLYILIALAVRAGEFYAPQARIEMANKPWVRITGVTVCSLIVLVYAMARYQHAH